MAEARMLADTADEHERMAILENIVSQLSFRERNAIVHMVSRCNDIVTALPVELILDTLKYLPITHVWLLQSVCRQWRSVFSSDRILRSTLARWECHNSSDTGIDDSSAYSAEPIRTKIRRMQAMRLGRPFASRLFTDHVRGLRGVLMTQSNRSFTMKGCRLAYIRSEHTGGDSVIVLDLLMNRELQFWGTARERIMSVACTSSIVAFVTYSGKLHVPDLKGRTPLLKVVQLPSASVSAFCADDNTVCIALKEHDGQNFLMIIYDCNTQTLKAFDLLSPDVLVRNITTYLSPKALLVNEREQVVDIFSQLCITSGAYGSREDVFVEHRRYGFDGKHVASSSWQRLGTPRSSKVPFELGDLHPSGYPGRYMLRTKLLQSSDSSRWSASPRAPPPVSLLAFDSKTAKISEHHFVGESQRSHLGDFGDYSSLALWKDVEMRAVGNVLFTSIEQQAGNWSSQGRYRISNGINMVNHSGVSQRSSSRLDDSAYSILINDTFIACFEQTPSTDDWQSCIKIFCFDEHLQWAGSRSTRLWELDTKGECMFPSWEGTVPKLPA